MSRKDARECAYKLIFEYLFNREESDTREIMFAASPDMSDGDKQYINDIVDGVKANFDELKAFIAPYVSHFDIDRVFKPDFAVLLLAVAEMRYRDDIPLKVTIDEAVELSKKYSVENGYKFVNGVLGAISRDMEARD